MHELIRRMAGEVGQEMVSSRLFRFEVPREF